MQSENRFFDDLAKLVNGAAGTVAGMTREFESNAREEVELLKARLDALEGKAPEPVTKTVRAAKTKAVDKDAGAE
jgi:BMFP domain-containing protein YqiC